MMMTVTRGGDDRPQRLAFLEGDQDFNFSGVQGPDEVIHDVTHAAVHRPTKPDDGEQGEDEGERPASSVVILSLGSLQVIHEPEDSIWIRWVMGHRSSFKVRSQVI